MSTVSSLDDFLPTMFIPCGLLANKECIHVTAVQIVGIVGCLSITLVREGKVLHSLKDFQSPHVPS